MCGSLFFAVRGGRIALGYLPADIQSMLVAWVEREEGEEGNVNIHLIYVMTNMDMYFIYAMARHMYVRFNAGVVCFFMCGAGWQDRVGLPSCPQGQLSSWHTPCSDQSTSVGCGGGRIALCYLPADIQSMLVARQGTCTCSLSGSLNFSVWGGVAGSR